jgi:uncharacterized ion transporter superfamily protein YfcC
MLFPKRGQPWTYKERTRLNSLIFSLIGLFWVVWGIVIGSWLMILLAVVVILCSVLIWLLSERKYRNEP